MISAYEAKTIAENSISEVDAVLKKIDIAIHHAAKRGEYTLSYHVDRCYWRNDAYEAEKRNRPFVELIIVALRTFGFGASIKEDHRTYRVGDDETDYHNVGLVITWK